MKKFIALFLSIIYMVFGTMGFAFADNLYFVKNSSPDSIKSSIVSTLLDKNYVIKEQDPYYAVSSKNANDYILIILQKSSANYFYYIAANSNTSVNKSILKTIKNKGFAYEESLNTQYLSMFQTQAQKVLSNTAGEYIFENVVAPQVIPNAVPTIQSDDTALRGAVVEVAKGSKFKTYLETPINTATANVGDEVRAVLSENWVVNGKTIASQGSLLTGKLSTARHASLGSRNGKVVFTFDTLTTPEGKSYSISTEEIDFTVTNEGKWAKAAGTVAIGAVAGILTGILIGACTKDSNRVATAAISAGVGAAAGLAEAALEKGVDAEIPIYTEMEVSLIRPLSVVVCY